MESSNAVTEPIVWVDRTVLQQLVIKLFQRKGMFAAEAQIVADGLIDADRDRLPTDGVATIPEYLEAMDLGEIDPRARMINVSETASIAVVDGSTGIGHVALKHAILLAMDKAKQVGTGTVLVTNSRPGGDLGGIARYAANAGLIGLATSSYDESSNDQTSGDTIGNFRLAVSIPASANQPSGVFRDSGQSRSAASVFCALLTSGLSGIDPKVRKRKSLRAANSVEHCVMVIDHCRFGSTAESIAKQFPTHTTMTDSIPAEQVPLAQSDAQALATMAAKVKFPVTW